MAEAVIVRVRGEPETYEFVDHQGFKCQVRRDVDGILCLGPRNNPLKLQPSVAEELGQMLMAYAANRPLSEGEKE